MRHKRPIAVLLVVAASVASSWSAETHDIRTITVVAAVDEEFRNAFGEQLREMLGEVVSRVSELYESELQLRFELDPRIRDWSYEGGAHRVRSALRAAIPLESDSTLVVGFTARDEFSEAGLAAASDPYVVIRRRPSVSANDELTYFLAHEVAHVFYAFHVGTETGADCHLMRVAIEIIGEEPCPGSPSFHPATLTILRATRGMDLSSDVRQLEAETLTLIIETYEAHAARASTNPIEIAFVELAQRHQRAGDINAAREVAEVVVEIA
ncbi:MAG: M12 family metallo-peptidase, partial [Deltaproteobacteria bacterium]|nr:M12 family metallo-peptidase [Deltaproteobacteria bacterium]